MTKGQPQDPRCGHQTPHRFYVLPDTSPACHGGERSVVLQGLHFRKTGLSTHSCRVVTRSLTFYPGMPGMKKT